LFGNLGRLGQQEIPDRAGNDAEKNHQHRNGPARPAGAHLVAQLPEFSLIGGAAKLIGQAVLTATLPKIGLGTSLGRRIERARTARGPPDNIPNALANDGFDFGVLKLGFKGPEQCPANHQVGYYLTARPALADLQTLGLLFDMAETRRVRVADKNGDDPVTSSACYKM